MSRNYTYAVPKAGSDHVQMIYFGRCSSNPAVV